MKNIKVLVIILFFTLFFFLPILIDPKILFERANDLENFVIPNFLFIKSQLVKTNHLPFWNNSILSGTPILADPQYRLLYPLNIIIYLLPLETGLLMSFILHIFLGGIGIFLAANKGFGFSKRTSLFITTLYIFSPKVAGFLEAGHFGLILSWAYLPYLLLSLIKLTKTPKLKWSLLLAISMTGIFYTHSVIFMIASVFSFLFFATFLYINKQNGWKKSLLHYLIGAVMAFGFSAISLLPQYSWKDYTTRYLLLENPDIYPKWTSIVEYIKNVTFPLANNIWKIDSEKWIPLGILTSILAFIGFFKLPKKYKLPLLVILFISVAISLNNASPFYGLLLTQKWLVLWRVATRIWIIPLFIVIFLAGFGLEKLKTRKNVQKAIALLAITEVLLISWTYLYKPIPTLNHLAPKGVYEFLKRDDDKFRVFCVNRCLSQKEAVKYELELIDGYSTLMQTNYFRHAWQLTGSYWNYYTLSVPPIGSYLHEEPQPDATSLGKYNTKYVLSPYELTDKNFILSTKIEDYFIYENSIFKKRVYFKNGDVGEAKIKTYSPNKIVIEVNSHSGGQIILAEVFSKGWKAYINGEEEVAIQETPNVLRAIDIKLNTKFIDIVYDPPGYALGKTITIVTLIGVLIGAILSRKKDLF